MKQLRYNRLLFIFFISILFIGCKKTEPVAKQFVLPSKIINKIIVDDLGVKWFATGKGLVSFDGVTWTSYTDDQLLSNGSISDLVFEPSSAPKKLWLGTNVGLSSFEFGTSSISTVNYNTNSPGILSDTLSALGIDAANIKYIGTSKGLSILNLDKWNHYFGRIGDGEPLLNYKISSVSVGGKGYIYAATQGGGVSRFKYTADAISGATTYNFPWAWGLPSDTVYTVVAIDTCQWYGTRRGAAYHTSENTKTDWVTYKRADGLICDSVYTIAKDLSGNIWFGTFNGVSKLTGDKWQSFTTKDGLIANKVNSIAVDLDGSIWFGTDEGISHFANNHWSNF